MAGYYNDFGANLKARIEKAVRGVHTCLPGTITAVNTETARVTVKPAGYVVSGGERHDHVPIAGVPVVFPYLSEDCGVYFPLKEGDPCLIIFAEQGLGVWAEEDDANSAVSHAYNNAICIPGIMKDPSDDFTEAIEDEAIIMRMGEQKIKITKDGIDVTGTLTLNGSPVSTN